MQQELYQFKINKFWELVLCLEDHLVIGKNWIFRNKFENKHNVVPNKERLVAKGYSPEECIDNDETYAPTSRLEAMRVLLDYSYYYDFMLHQMDIKSVFF